MGWRQRARQPRRRRLRHAALDNRYLWLKRMRHVQIVRGEGFGGPVQLPGDSSSNGQCLDLQDECCTLATHLNSRSNAQVPAAADCADYAIYNI